MAGRASGANALGGTVTALQVARMRDNTQLWRLRVFSLGVVAAGVAVLAITPNHLVALPVLFFLGGAATTFQTANMSMSLILAEPVYHGRVQSLVMIAFSAQSLVAFPLGALADQIGLREMHGYMAAATVLVVVWSVLAAAPPVARQSGPQLSPGAHQPSRAAHGDAVGGASALDHGAQCCLHAVDHMHVGIRRDGRCR